MKTPHDTFIAVMEGMRFEHDLKLDSAEGAYAMYPSWNIAEIGFPPYEDMTVVFYQLPLEADYNEMAKVYRSYKFAHDPAVRTLKERIKDRPELKTLADSIALRQTHAGKPWHPQKNKVDFTPETEPPVRTHRTYDETLGYLKSSSRPALKTWRFAWRAGRRAATTDAAPRRSPWRRGRAARRASAVSARAAVRSATLWTRMRTTPTALPARRSGTTATSPASGRKARASAMALGAAARRTICA
jgi:hypothetical protein